MSEFCVILTTTNDKEKAQNIASWLIENDLAACVQINKVKSIYKWQQKVEAEKEYRLTIKSFSSKYLQIEDAIKKLHNYETPQIIKLDITGGEEKYLQFLRGNSKE